MTKNQPKAAPVDEPPRGLLDQDADHEQGEHRPEDEHQRLVDVQRVGTRTREGEPLDYLQKKFVRHFSLK
jgi:hypothetical protein